MSAVGHVSFTRRFLNWFGHPEKNAAPSAQKKSASLASPTFRSYMVMPGQPVWMDRNYGQFAQEAYMKNVIAYRAINMVAQAAACVPFELVYTNARGVRKELPNHPIQRLLCRPNPKQAYSDFFHSLYTYRMISGNAFIQVAGPKGEAPQELHLLRPDRVAVIAGKHAMPSGYRYTVGDREKHFPVDPISGYSNILHVKNFHPVHDWYGLSPVEAAAYSIDQHNQASAWNQALLQNGARPSGALVVKAQGGEPGMLSEDQYTRLRQQVDEQFSGVDNAGRPLLLEGGLEWKEMSLSPHDMDYVQARHASSRDIALAFGVPPQLLGIPGDNTYSNLQEARLALWEQTVLPLLRSTGDALAAWLSPVYGIQADLVANTDDVMPLAMRNQAIWDRVEKASFLSEDEKRAAVGYPTVDEMSA